MRGHSLLIHPSHFGPHDGSVGRSFGAWSIGRVFFGGSVGRSVLLGTWSSCPRLDPLMYFLEICSSSFGYLSIFNIKKKMCLTSIFFLSKFVSLKLMSLISRWYQEGQASHFQRFLDSEHAQNEAWRARQRLQTLQQELNTKLVSCYRNLPGNVELAR